MTTETFKLAFRQTVTDWEAGKLTAHQAMQVMAALQQSWLGLEGAGEAPAAGEKQAIKSAASDPPPPCGASR